MEYYYQRGISIWTVVSFHAEKIQELRQFKTPAQSVHRRRYLMMGNEEILPKSAK